MFSAKRSGKQRYPSEKKKIKLKHKETLAEVKTRNKFQGIWRLSKLGVTVDKDPGKDFLGVSDGLLEAIAKVLEFPVIWAFVIFYWFMRKWRKKMEKENAFFFFREMLF